MAVEKRMYFKSSYTTPQVKRPRTFEVGEEVTARVPSGVPPVYANGYLEVTADRTRWYLVPADKLQEQLING